MTAIEIQEQVRKQIEALQKATDIATKSKEAANKYLQDAGIIPKEKEGKFDDKKK